MSGLSSRICSWLSSLLSHSISDCTNYGQSLGVKCSLTHPFSLLNLVLLSQVPETNQPTRTKQNFRNVVFSTNKKYNPTDWRFWCYRNCSHFCSSFVHSLGDVCLGEQTSKRETGRAVLTVLNRLNNGQPIFFPPPFYRFYHICFYFFLWVKDWNLYKSRLWYILVGNWRNWIKSD